MWAIFAVTIIGLVLTADNEPPAPMKVEKEERTSLVKGGVPNNENDTIVVIKNPYRLP
jgi:hypothetical protein